VRVRGEELGRDLLAGPMGSRLGKKLVGPKGHHAEGRVGAFLFFIPFPKPFLNIILNAK